MILHPLNTLPHRHRSQEGDFRLVCQCVMRGSCQNRSQPVQSWDKMPLRLEERASQAIGIGESLAAPPLPHHRTYGSVYGGSAD